MNSPVPSQHLSPDTTMSCHQRAQSVTPPESPSAKTPSRPTIIPPTPTAIQAA